MHVTKDVGNCLSSHSTDCIVQFVAETESNESLYSLPPHLHALMSKHAGVLLGVAEELYGLG